MGVGCLGVLLLVLYLFVSAGPDAPTRKRAPTKADTNLLTGQDTRTLGLEAVGAELREAQRRQRELEGQLAKLSQAASSKEEVKALSSELKAIADSLKENGASRARALEELRRSPSLPAAPVRTPPDAQPGASPQGPQSTTGESHRAPATSSRSPRVDAPVEPIKIQVFGEATTTATVPPAVTRTAIDLPVGSVLRGVLLTGADGHAVQA
jgi:hypothetical protein